MDSVDPRISEKRIPAPRSSLQSELEPLLEKLRNSTDLSAQSRAKFLDLLDRFQTFLSVGHGVTSMAQVTKAQVELFTAVPSSVNPTAEPAVATMHVRRAAVRLLFRIARESGYEVSDPTLDLSLPARARRLVRPLTDAEIMVGRRASLHTLTETRLPAVWALAEATVRTAELPSILVSDVDLAHGTLLIHGSSRTKPRLGPLTPWGIRQLRRRLERLGAKGTQNAAVIYQGELGGASGQASASAAVSWTLRRAGLPADPGVSPASVAAWAGRRLFDEGVALEEVARRLGIRSLDRTAIFIGLDRGER